jgi:fructoselysine-6-P-deglycase FrlB-like protein
LYQTTQDNIFECALLKSKYAAHTQIIKDYDPAKKSKEYLEKLNESVKKQLREKECLSADDADKVYNYKDLLDSLTYEECVYNMYLYYYEEKV